MNNIEKGMIKVVWLSKNSNRINSIMFDDIKKAEKFGKSKKDYLIFRLLKNKNMKEFEWEILPYGNYYEYIGIVKSYQKYGKKFHRFIENFFKS